MVLKSFPGRSLRKTWNMGAFRLNPWDAAWIVSIISQISNSVLGPDEHPKSATFRHSHSGELLRYTSTMLSSSIGFALSIASFWNTMKNKETND
jgi:hypothetical protein